MIRAHTPGFDPAVSPSRWMGVIAETVRTWPGARRSDHPQVSFAAVRTPGGQAWIRWQDVDTDESDFDQVGAAFETTGNTRTGRVGAAECRLMRQRALIDFAVDWLATHRKTR